MVIPAVRPCRTILGGVDVVIRAHRPQWLAGTRPVIPAHRFDREISMLREFGRRSIHQHVDCLRSCRLAISKQCRMCSPRVRVRVFYRAGPANSHLRHIRSPRASPLPSIHASPGSRAIPACGKATPECRNCAAFSRGASRRPRAARSADRAYGGNSVKMTCRSDAVSSGAWRAMHFLRSLGCA